MYNGIKVTNYGASVYFVCVFIVGDMVVLNLFLAHDILFVETLHGKFVTTLVFNQLDSAKAALSEHSDNLEVSNAHLLLCKRELTRLL